MNSSRPSFGAPRAHPRSPRVPTLLGSLAVWILLGASPPAIHAQTATGTAEGRVFNARSGGYVENARVTIEGTAIEVFTDPSGYYRIPNLPPGAVSVRVFFTGFDRQTASVRVSPGETVQRNFVLGAADGERPPSEGEIVRLSEFVVGASREMEGAAIAINEQRFAPNIMNVVAADEFGSVAEGNVGEFMKFLPGITIGYVGGETRSISMSGVPANYVPVTLGGFDLSSAAASTTARTVELDQVSINNLSRIEVLHSPTPESPGSALAGTVNMVPRSAFERTRPVFTGRAFLMMRSDARNFGRDPGSLKTPRREVFPGVEFSYIVPVNARFGFTLSGGTRRRRFWNATVRTRRRPRGCIR